MTDQNAVETNTAEKTIKLGGRDWPIPILSPKQNRIIVPGFLKLAAPSSTDRYAIALDIVYAALTRAHPYLTREEFEELPIRFDEALAALTVIQEQAGIPKPTKRDPTDSSATSKPLQDV